MLISIKYKVSRREEHGGTRMSIHSALSKQLSLSTLQQLAAGRLRSCFSRLALKRTAARARNRLFVAYEKSLSSLSHRQTLRILFTGKPDWTADIKEGFKGSRHHVEFGSLQTHRFNEFDLVVPLEILGLIEAGRHPELVARNPIPIPTEEIIMLFDDKQKFSETLIQKGFGSYIPRIFKNGDPPFVLKKRIGSWGKECLMILSHEDALKASDQLNDPAYYCQQIIRGRTEFATHILFANNKIVEAFDIKYEFESDIPIKGQIRPLYTEVRNCPYLELFASVLRSIGFEGLCCVNYKVVGDHPYIFEINPRFGGTLCPYFFSFLRHLKPVA
jgi:hypothetical protein